jgi:hypothetical protein
VFLRKKKQQVVAMVIVSKTVVTAKQLIGPDRQHKNTHRRLMTVKGKGAAGQEISEAPE